MMRKVLKITGIGLGVVVGLILLLALYLYLFVHEQRPKGEATPQADRLAQRMLEAVNDEAWDTTRFVRWSFASHTYLWDKERNFARIEWNKNRVLLKLNHGAEGVVFRRGKELSGEGAEQLLQKAWALFCNDSYWLAAPFKVMERVVERKVVRKKGKPPALLVTFTSGGVTPGDSYVWHFGQNGLPESFEMWVSVMPVGGLEATWGDWKILSTGAKVATQHKLFGVEFGCKGVQAGMQLPDVGADRGVFAPLAGQ